jgi:hypothetical protein
MRGMMFKAKILFSILLLLLCVGLSVAAEFTYQEYTRAPEPWKRGFVFGVSRYMSAVAQPDEEPPYPVRTAFQQCLATSTDTVIVRQVEAYIATNPASSKEPMLRSSRGHSLICAGRKLKGAIAEGNTKPKMNA